MNEDDSKELFHDGIQRRMAGVKETARADLGAMCRTRMLIATGENCNGVILVADNREISISTLMAFARPDIHVVKTPQHFRTVGFAFGMKGRGQGFHAVLAEGFLTYSTPASVAKTGPATVARALRLLLSIPAE